MQLKLGNAPLTDKDVVIYDVHDEGSDKENIIQSEASDLTTEEHKLFTKAFNVEKLNGGKASLEDELDDEVSNGKVSSTKGIIHLFASENYYRSSAINSTGKSINKKSDLTPGVGTDVYMMAHDIYGDDKIHAGKQLVENGTILMGDKFSQGLKNLAAQIKKNDGVPNVNITGQYNYVPNTSNEDAKTIQKGINNFSQNLIKILKAAGAKSVKVNIKIGTNNTNTGFRHVEATD